MHLLRGDRAVAHDGERERPFGDGAYTCGWGPADTAEPVDP
jgi:hypothetical protein